MLAPTSLPSWWAFNEAVLQALAGRLAEATNQQFSEARLAVLLSRRERHKSFTPDFMAQLMEEEAGTAYFRVLEVLDTEEINENHNLVAALAGAGVVRAVVTTNFDRLLERALDAAAVPYRAFVTSADFDQLPELVETAPECLLLKVHGSVERPDSMVDTLAQRVAGRPKVLEDSIAGLLERHACLAVGFSGADLAYDENYLGLRAAAAQAVELTVLNRAGQEPLDAITRLVEAYGPRARILDGELPSALHATLDALGVEAPAAVPAVERGEAQAGRLARRTTDWVSELGTVTALNMFVSLVDSGAYDETMLRFLMFFKRYYRTTEDGLDPAYWRFELNYGRRLLDEGLLGQYQPEEVGLTVPGFRDVEASSYVTAIQFLGRAGNADTGGDLLEGRIELARAAGLLYGPAKVLGNVQQVVTEAGDRGPRLMADAALLAAEMLELVGRKADAVRWARVAYAAAREIGDDPRRGTVAARAARSLALSGELDDARELSDLALEIGTRLDLPAIEADGLAARGLVEVFGTHDPAETQRAIEPLSRAAGLYRYLRRRPRLLLTLCDLVRATYYAGSAEEFEAAITELDELWPAFSGLAPHALMAKVELLAHAGQPEAARAEAERLLDVARETGNTWAEEKAQPYLQP